MALGLMLEVLFAATCTLLLAGLCWWGFGLLLRPHGTPGGVWVVVWARGEGEDLEQRLRGLMWLRGLGLLPGPVLVVDAGLSDEGRALARRLAARWPLCLAEERQNPEP